MTTSEAIRKLARAGIRIYPIRYYGSFKMVIETSEHPVGIRTSGTQRIGKKLYNAKEKIKKQVMSNIPNSEKKGVIAHKWYKNDSARQILNICNEILIKNNGSKFDKIMRKQHIVALIEEIGLPGFTTNEDYEEYINDPMIKKKFSSQKIKNINVELD
jgi:hypothetical protein